MIKRHLQGILKESLKHFPVVLLTGARQVGKSTLAQTIPTSRWKARYLTLDDRTVLDAALTDPDGFIQNAQIPVIIDEIQRAPDLLRAIKLVVDKNRRPGMFLLTGSSNILTMAKVSETLAGRVAVHELYPFSWAEWNNQPPPTTVDDLFSHVSARALVRAWSKKRARRRGRGEIQPLILRGGFPTPALMNNESARRTWFESYRQTYVERDMRDIAGIEHLPDFGRLMSTLALRTGQILNLSALSRDVALPFSTLRRYFHILERTYQVFLVHPYSANIRKRLVKTPKVFQVDAGMACHLSAAPSWQTLISQNRVGPLVETWAAGELRKILPFSRTRTTLWYWRTRLGREVDFILERGEDVMGIEIKWGAGFGRSDLAGLQECRAALGKRFRFGLLLHGGEECVAIDDKLLAVPFDRFLSPC